MEILETYVLPHWAFFGAAIIFAVFGQITKKFIFTHERAAKSKAMRWGRRTLALHPVASGALLGLVPGISGDMTTAESCLYFATAGVLSTWIYSALKGFAKSRGVEVTLPGASEPPNK